MKTRWVPLLAVAGLLAAGGPGVAGAQEQPALSMEAVVEAYVDSHASVREARTRLETAQADYERKTRVASAPSLGASAATRATADGGGREPPSVANGELTLTWAPVAPLSLQAQAWHGSGREDPGTGSSSRETSTILSLEASWTLWPPPGSQPRNLDAEQARLALDQARRALETAIDQARLEGQRLYQQARLGRARLEIARQRLDAAERDLARTLEQRAAGLVSEEAVLEARSAAQSAALAAHQALATLSGIERQLGVTADRLPALPRGDELVDLARRAARTILDHLTASAGTAGLPAVVPEQEPSGGVMRGIPPLPEEVLERLVAGSVEVAHARQQLELARRRLNAVRQRVGGATVGAAWSRTTQRGSSQEQLTLSLAASLDPFDGGARRLDEADAARAVRDAEQAVADAEAQVRREALARWDEVGSAILQLASARMELELAELTWEAARGRYERGVASVAQLEQADLGRSEAALDLLEAAETLRQAWQQLMSELAPGAGAGSKPVEGGR